LNNAILKKFLITCFFILFASLAFTNTLDRVAEEYTEVGIERALISFTIARGLNGVISVAQGTEFALSPAGVGLTFAPGQILDPINDLIERFSWVLMVSGSSLGIQRLFLEITSSPYISLLFAIFSGLYIFLLWFPGLWQLIKNEKTRDLSQSVLGKSLVLLIFIRFSIPVIALFNEVIYQQFLQPQFTAAQSNLENTAEQIKQLNDASREIDKEKNEDIMNQVGQWFDKTKQTLNIEKRMQALKLVVSDMSHQVINLIVVFVMQTIIFPLMFIWILMQSAKAIMRSFSQ